VRDGSKLLVVKGTSVSEDLFTNLPSHLAPEQYLVFNDTRVIRARLLFSKPTGGRVEIFCLNPVEPAETETAFHAKGHSVWKCLVGGVKKWKGGVIQLSHLVTLSPCHLVTIYAERGAALPDGAYEIRFSWEPEGMTFAEVLESLGHIPLPPYIHRDDTLQDLERYQTIYAEHDGSVAAPTAGLHFTPAVMDALRQKGCGFGYVTLHVGAGTFRPMTEPEVSRHVMHREKISVPVQMIREILARRDNGLIAIGTTASRTLESLYWAGVKLIVDGNRIHPEVNQWDPYNDTYNREIPLAESIQALILYLESNGMSEYRGETQLMILPGYRFRLADGLLTNFHMPGSTLLLLVSAFSGEVWKEAYRFALDRDFRFLSYGDACLFLK
jgi:S-adenosylmethionine:tRNA ribosyltransferase-isomerase